jgi:CHAT domain-containing protein
LHPFLRTLEEQLAGFKSTRGKRITPVVAYADDVTVFVTQPADFTIIQQAVQCYERATGAKLNSQKSKAIAIGNWTEPATALGITFHNQATILGVNFGPTIAKSITDSWAEIVQTVRAQARSASIRTLCLAQLLQSVRQSFLAKIWYLAQILPPINIHVQQLTAVVSWFVWHGSTFRVPMSTLQRSKDQEGWAMENIAIKCRTLLCYRLWPMKTRDGAITTTLLRKWKLDNTIANPPNAKGLPHTLPYILQYAM